MKLREQQLKQMNLPNKLSKFVVTKKARSIYDSGVRRAKTLQELKLCISARTHGEGNHAIGVYVKIAELPDDVNERDIDRLITDIGVDYKDPVK